MKAGLHFGEEKGAGREGRGEGDGERDADKKAAEAAITNPLMSKLNEGGGGGGGEGRDRNGKFSLSGNATAEKKWEGAKGRRQGGREAGREGGRLSSAN